ncbi:MAG: trypsin-like peptidase domain-containing protein [Thiothrix sp.]|nr:trypsin-like peptidase domain-containing protein [Thiothrix sp.]HPQ95565.1 trypsin-like peptidase domain-containing protein [Thiolinea sp.]
MARLLRVGLILWLLGAGAPAARAGTDAEVPASPQLDSVVEVFSTSTLWSRYEPWNSGFMRSIGSGFVVAGQHILTNAHVVENAVFIAVRTDNSTRFHEARVAFIAHEVDLAVLSLVDEDFFADKPPLPLGEVPPLEQEIRLYGYPVGGERVSITKGIVSRIEYHRYIHSNMGFQSIQVDAAINEGNSGGPAMVDGKVVGVAVETDPQHENIGYVIPVTLVRHFLDDIADGRLDGFPALPLEFQELSNPAQKKHYKLTDDQSGVLVTTLCADTDTANTLQLGDIITHIDGRAIADNALVKLDETRAISFLHFVDIHQLDDIVQLDIVRDGVSMKVNVKLNTAQKSVRDEVVPRYFIYGGFVFLGTANDSGCREVDSDGSTENDEVEDVDTVELVNVLPTLDNIGFHDVAPLTLKKVNGMDFSSFHEFYELVRGTSEKTILIEGEDGFQLTIDRQRADSTDTGVLKSYRIDRAASEGLE